MRKDGQQDMHMEDLMGSSEYIEPSRRSSFREPGSTKGRVESSILLRERTYPNTYYTIAPVT